MVPVLSHFLYIKRKTPMGHLKWANSWCGSENVNQKEKYEIWRGASLSVSHTPPGYIYSWVHPSPTLYSTQPCPWGGWKQKKNVLLQHSLMLVCFPFKYQSVIGLWTHSIKLDDEPNLCVVLKLEIVHLLRDWKCFGSQTVMIWGCTQRIDLLMMMFGATTVCR